MRRVLYGSGGDEGAVVLGELEVVCADGSGGLVAPDPEEAAGYGGVVANLVVERSGADGDSDRISG